MTTGAAPTGGAPTGAAPTGGAPTGAAPTGAAPTGAAPTGGRPTGVSDPRVKTLAVPDKYQNESWAKEVKDVEDLWAKMAGAQKLLGKDKIVLPGEGATEDELNAFYTRMGRPENPEGYVFQSIEELKDVERNVEMDHKMKSILFKNGVSKKAAESIVSEYERTMYEHHKPLLDEAAKRDVEFQKLADEVLGEDKAGAMEAFKSVMRESLGDKAFLASKIESMSNEELMPLIVLSKNIHDKYVGENRVRVAPGGGGLSGDLKADFQAISGQKLAIKMDKNMPEHIKKMKLANLNLQMQKIGVKAKEQGVDLFN